ncbi:MAG: VWA domain-containing protein [Pyrinomonadaceae bacterium]|nr:VWA domain-containing protein [Pyrinomonadaceae bacterium]
MKISQITLATLLIGIVGIGFVFSQDNSKKDKPKDKQRTIKPVAVKANLLILNANGKFADDVKLEDCKIYEDGIEQKLTYFARKQNAFNVGLVVDNTGSMRSQLETVVSAGATFVANIRPQDEVFVTRFVSSNKVEIVQNWTADKNRLKNALANLYIEGGKSAVIDALYLSVGEISKREKADQTVRNALILISDGEDRDSFYNERQLFELFKGSDTQVFTIGLVGQFFDAESKSAAKKFINQLSFETGGASFFVNGKKDELVAAL